VINQLTKLVAIVKAGFVIMKQSNEKIIHLNRVGTNTLIVVPVCEKIPNPIKRNKNSVSTAMNPILEK